MIYLMGILIIVIAADAVVINRMVDKDLKRIENAIHYVSNHVGSTLGYMQEELNDIASHLADINTSTEGIDANAAYWVEKDGGENNE